MCFRFILLLEMLHNLISGKMLERELPSRDRELLRFFQNLNKFRLPRIFKYFVVNLNRLELLHIEKVCLYFFKYELVIAEFLRHKASQVTYQ